MKSRTEPLADAELELQARQLADQLHAAQQERCLDIARLLVGSSPRELFNASEFKLRDLVLDLGADCLETYLTQKKTATMAPVWPVPTATAPPASKAIEASEPSP